MTLFVDYWYLVPYAIVFLMLMVFLAVRLALDWRDAQPKGWHGERYGAGLYIKLPQPRDNYRR